MLSVYRALPNSSRQTAARDPQVAFGWARRVVFYLGFRVEGAGLHCGQISKDESWRLTTSGLGLWGLGFGVLG